jgi:hypothetical protein
MSKRPATADLEPSPGRSAASALPLWAKFAISALVTLHVAAVVSPPLAFICRSGGSSSPLAEPIARFFQPYTTAAYLDHGYAFFAPDPGPNHLVDFKVEFDDGREPKTGRFPNLATERPRLLYHRHFMLAEALNTRFVPPVFPPEPSPPPLTASVSERERHAAEKRDYEAAKVRWQRARRTYEAMRASIEAHLKAEYGGQRVTLTRVEHRPAEPNEILIEDEPSLQTPPRLDLCRSECLECLLVHASIAAHAGRNSHFCWRDAALLSRGVVVFVGRFSRAKQLAQCFDCLPP